MTFVLKPDPRQQVWFEACDELGMMVDQGNYGTPPNPDKSRSAAVDPDEQPDLFAGTLAMATALCAHRRLTPPANFEGSLRLYLETFETYARHPSIIIYILSNEQPGPNGTNSIWHPLPLQSLRPASTRGTLRESSSATPASASGRRETSTTSTAIGA